MKKSVVLLTIGFIFIAALPVSAALLDDLVIYYAFDESSGDVAFNGIGSYNGTIYNSNGSQWVSGKIGGALEFNGAN